jgi:hypothetical protein
MSERASFNAFVLTMFATRKSDEIKMNRKIKVLSDVMDKLMSD